MRPLLGELYAKVTDALLQPDQTRKRLQGNVQARVSLSVKVSEVLLQVSDPKASGK